MKGSSAFPIAIGAVCLTFALHEFMIWLRRRERGFDLSFAITCLIAGLYDLACAGQYSVGAPAQSVPWLRAQAITLSLSACAFLVYLSGRTRLVPRSHLAVFSGWTAASVIAQVLGFGTLTWDAGRPSITNVSLPLGLSAQYLEVGSGLLTNLQLMGGFVLFAYFLWVTWRFRRTSRREAWRLFLLLSVGCLTYLNDVAVFFRLYAFIFTIQYGWLSAVIYVAGQRSRDLVEAGEIKRDLVESEERFRAFVEQSSEAIIMTDEAGTVVTYNQAAETLTGIPRAEAVNQPIWDLATRTVPAVRLTRETREAVERHYREALSRAGDGKEIQRYEDVLQRPDGTLRSFLHNEFLVHTQRGHRVGTISHDITAIKLSEAQVLASLQEKTVLLKEIHHRVKNNLQLISSLLYLQSSRVESPAALSALQNSRDQVLSIALVHEDLYRSKDFTEIDFGAYLRRLAARLMSAYPASTGITFVDEGIQSVSLGVDQAIPCGLIVNELCSNVLRHAFPEGRAGQARELRIELSRPVPDQVILAVADTGIGIPQDVSFDSAPTLGMQIVSQLVRQLQGAVRVTGGKNGTRIEVEFPVRESAK